MSDQKIVICWDLCDFGSAFRLTTCVTCEDLRCLRYKLKTKKATIKIMARIGNKVMKQVAEAFEIEEKVVYNLVS